MRAKLSDGKVYRITFKHYRGDLIDVWAPRHIEESRYIHEGLDRIEARLNVPSFRIIAGTECWITPEGEERSAVSHGVSGCHSNDEFDIEEGRRIALGRAIQSVIPRANLDDRKALWKAYFERGAAEEKNRALTEAMRNAQAS